MRQRIKQILNLQDTLDTKVVGLDASALAALTTDANGQIVYYEDGEFKISGESAKVTALLNQLTDKTAFDLNDSANETIQAIDFYDGYYYSVNSSYTISKFDGETGELVADYDVADYDNSFYPTFRTITIDQSTGVAYMSQTSSSDSALYAIDLATMTYTGTNIVDGVNVTAFLDTFVLYAWYNGMLWYLDWQNATLYEYDPSTGAATGTSHSLSGYFVNAPSSIYIESDGILWYSQPDGNIWAFDLESGTIDVGKSFASTYNNVSYALYVWNDIIWLSSSSQTYNFDKSTGTQTTFSSYGTKNFYANSDGTEFRIMPKATGDNFVWYALQDLFYFEVGELITSTVTNAGAVTTDSIVADRGTVANVGSSDLAIVNRLLVESHIAGVEVSGTLANNEIYVYKSSTGYLEPYNITEIVGSREITFEDPTNTFFVFDDSSADQYKFAFIEHKGFGYAGSRSSTGSDGEINVYNLNEISNDMSSGANVDPIATISGVESSGLFAYDDILVSTNSSQQTITFYDISDPENIALLQTYSAGSWVRNIVGKYGDYLYISWNASILGVVDISDLDNISHNIPTDTNLSVYLWAGRIIYGDYLLEGGGDDGTYTTVNIFDLSADPTEPTLLGTYSTPFSNSYAITGFVVLEDKGLMGLRVNNPAVVDAYDTVKLSDISTGTLTSQGTFTHADLDGSITDNRSTRNPTYYNGYIVDAADGSLVLLDIADLTNITGYSVPTNGIFRGGQGNSPVIYKNMILAPNGNTTADFFIYFITNAISKVSATIGRLDATEIAVERLLTGTAKLDNIKKETLQGNLSEIDTLFTLLKQFTQTNIDYSTSTGTTTLVDSTLFGAFISDKDCTITSIGFDIYYYQVGDVMSVGIFDASENLLASTTDATVAEEHNVLTFDEPVNLDANTKYWVGFYFGGTNTTSLRAFELSTTDDIIAVLHATSTDLASSSISSGVSASVVPYFKIIGTLR